MKFLSIIASFFVLLGMMTTTGAQVVEIQGFVKSVDGKPIKDVFIDRFGRTDENGYFRIASDTLIRYRKALVLDKKGFVPKVVSLDASNTNLDIVLEREKDNSIWEIPTCNFGKTDHKRTAGQYVKLTVPKKFKYKSGLDTDYRYYSIGIVTNGKKFWLRGGLGNLYGGVYPSDLALSDLQNYSYRRTSVGIDWRGTTKDGNYWRYFGAVSLFETYHYETDSKEAAEVFDSLIDRVCFQPPE